MNSSKDYYAILGVSPLAEDIVIRAAYRALAQRYHPDRFTGSTEEANARMVELNEAYSILSDPAKRKAYDNSRGTGTSDASFMFDAAQDATPPGTDPLEEDWQVAVGFYPDLADFARRLCVLSWRLVNAYRAYLLESKQFANRDKIANEMEEEFYQSYFGSNSAILAFARKLISLKHRDAALALNSAVRVLGSDTDPERVIAGLARRFNLIEKIVDLDKIRALVTNVGNSFYEARLHADLIEQLGGKATSSATGPCDTTSWHVTFAGENQTFKTDFEFQMWSKDHVVPIAKSYLD